jgi:hypothetical protein
VNAADPVSLVLDLLISHDRFGSNSDPSLNGHLHYPNDIDKSLNESVTDKIRQYRADYNHNPQGSVSLMASIDSTSGQLHVHFFKKKLKKIYYFSTEKALPDYPLS